MNLDTRRHQQLGLYLIGIALVSALVVLMSAMLLMNQRFERVSSDARDHDQQNRRLRQVQLLNLTLLKIESAQRGYLLTGESAYLEPYISALTQMPGLLDKLGELPEPYPDLKGSVIDVRESIDTKLHELRQTIHLYQSGQRSGAIELVATGIGANALERAADRLSDIMEHIRAQRNAATTAILGSGESTKALAYTALWALNVCTVLAIVQIILLLRARTRYEEELANSELRYRQIVEEQSELVSLATSDGILTYVNPSYARHFSSSRDELVGKNLFDHVEPSDRPRLREVLDDLFLTGELSYGENRMLSPDGQERWVAWTNSLQLSESGEPMLHSVGRDVTAQKIAERSLRHSEEFLRRTGRVGGIGGWEIHLSSGAVTWSEQVRLIYEVSTDFVPTIESVMGFFEPEARERAELAGREAVLIGTPYDIELPIITAKGRSIYVRLVGEAEVGSDGQPIRLVGALQDITARRLLQDQLQESERFLREVTDNVPIALSFVDLQGRCEFANQAMTKRTGLTRVEIVDSDRVELCPTTPAFSQERMNEVLNGLAQQFLVEERYGDESRLIETQLLPAYDSRGDVKGFYSTGVDITSLKRTEQRLLELTEILENTPDFVVQTDPSGRIQYLNASARSALGLSCNSEAVTQIFPDFYGVEANQQLKLVVLPAVRRDGVWVGETQLLSATGQKIPVNQVVIGHKGPAGQLLRFSSIMRDISDAVAARTELERQTSTLQAIIEAIPALVVVFDKEQRYRLVNREFERQRGMTRDQVIGRTVRELFGREEWSLRAAQVLRVLQGETFNFETPDNISRTTKFVNVTYIPLRMSDGSIDGFIAVAQDITTHREEKKRLLSLAETDALTGLLNRAGFMSALSSSLVQSDQGVALLYIDLDKFKPVNDTYGHAAGDEVLRQLSHRLRRAVRPTDPVARLGGDEFAVILVGMEENAKAEAVARKVVLAASDAFVVNGQEICIGASVGVAMALANEDPARLMARADALVYEAKGAGRGCVAT